VIGQRLALNGVTRIVTGKAQRNIGGDSRGNYPRHRVCPLNQVPHHFCALGISWIILSRKMQMHREDVVSAEAELCVLKFLKVLDH
jgi:hypothetical protein